MSLEGFDRYWFDVLQTGDFTVGSGQGEPSKYWVAEKFVPTNDLKVGCQKFHSAVRQFRTLQDHNVRQLLKKWCPAAVPARTMVNKAQVRGYDLPALAVARSSFEAALGGKVDWQ
jgi:hypothetical protein